MTSFWVVDLYAIWEDIDDSVDNQFIFMNLDIWYSFYKFEV